MSGHARGPWEYNDPRHYSQVTGKFSDVAVYARGTAFPWRMCEVSGFDDANTIANARLIAAAPELLEALELADATLRGSNMNRAVVERKVAAAIAKAKGETA